jgi:hypothetical protein
MEYLIGFLLSFAVAVLAAIIGLDRDRAFYPTVLCVIASYYVLFAVLGGGGQTLVIEIAVASVFSLFAVLAYVGCCLEIAPTLLCADAVM